MFRLKIALLSVLLSGVVLGGVGIYSLSVLNRVGLERIDREILSLGEGRLAVKLPREYWQNFDKSLRLIYPEAQSGNLVVLVKDPGNAVLFQSPHWPPAVSEDSFPGFDRTMDRRRSAPAGEEISPDLRRGPPPRAYQACMDKEPGSRAQFVNPRGEIVQGICEERDGELVLRPDRRVAAPERRGENRRVPPPRPDERPPRIKQPSFTTIRTDSGVWRAGIMGSGRITLMVGMNLAGYYEDANRYRRAFLSILPVALLLLAAGGWFIAERALKPVALITRTAEGMTARGLDQRIPPVNADRELSRLVEVINDMLARLEKSFGQASRFSADAAHELQTPLTVLQGELEDALQHAPAGSEEQRRAGSLLEEVQRLKAIVQKLLILARADAGRLNLALKPVDLSAMVESAAEDAGALAPTVRIETEIAPGVFVMADPELMGQVIGNLTSNAVKYNKEQGVIRFRVAVHSAKALVTVSNTGPSIPEKDRERIFDRFFRADQSRSKTVPGAGLGLSLAREIIHAHQGDLRLDPPSGDMVSFTLSLPVAS